MTHSRTLWIGGTVAVAALAVAVLVTKGQTVRTARERSAAGSEAKVMIAAAVLGVLVRPRVGRERAGDVARRRYWRRSIL